MSYKRPKYCNFSNLIIPIGIFLVILSCGVNKTAAPTDIENNIKLAPKIVFINYGIKKDDSGKKTVHFLSAKKTEGKLKGIKKVIVNKGDLEDLICTQFDESSRILSQQHIKNPLKKTIEFIDENKNFNHFEQELDSAQFTVRMQLYPETKVIAISINKETKPLLLTNVSDL